MNTKQNASTRQPVQPVFRLAVRCLCVRAGRVLLVRHVSANSGREFWTFPGGLVEKGESLHTAACRELTEETGLTGTPAGILALYEFSQNNLIEVLIAFSDLHGEAVLGHDPEISEDAPRVLQEVKWFSIDELPEIQQKSVIKDYLSQPEKMQIQMPFNLNFN